LAAGFAELIPAGHIERRLHIEMAAQRLVYSPVHHLKLGWVEPQKVRRHFGDPGARSCGIRSLIGRAQRADLAVTVIPASVSMATTVESNTSTELPPDHLSLPS
jgi:hypothetical protein